MNDPSRRTTHELDVIVLGLDRMLALGEAKWGETMGLAHLERLRRIRDLLAAQGRPGAADARLACFSGRGFSDELRQVTDRDDGVVLVTAADLYTGD